MAAQPRSHHVRGGSTERRARMLTLQSLYTHDARGGAREDMDATLDWLCAEKPRPPSSARRRAKTMTAGILENTAGLDDVIQRYAPALPVNLLAIVDRNILRMAIYELTATQWWTPGRVVINEATDLASMFGSESSARFVNGVLGSVLNDLAVALAPGSQQ